MCSDVNYLRAQVGMQLISLINKVTGLEYDMHLRTWHNTRSLFNFLGNTCSSQKHVVVSHEY